MLYDGLVDNHDIHKLPSNLKLLRYYRKECHPLKNIESMRLKKKAEKLELYLMMKSIQLLLIIPEQSNLILRTHYVLRDYEQLKGMNSLYLYLKEHTNTYIAYVSKTLVKQKKSSNRKE